MRDPQRRAHHEIECFFGTTVGGMPVYHLRGKAGLVTSTSLPSKRSMPASMPERMLAVSSTSGRVTSGFGSDVKSEVAHRFRCVLREASRSAFTFSASVVRFCASLALRVSAWAAVSFPGCALRFSICALLARANSRPHQIPEAELPRAVRMTASTFQSIIVISLRGLKKRPMQTQTRGKASGVILILYHLLDVVS